VGALLADLAAIVPDWQLCVGREVTKVFEEFRRGPAAEFAAAFADEHADARGEFTVVVAPPASAREGADDAAAAADDRIDRLVRALLDQGVTPKTVARALSELPGINHKQAYERVLALAQRR
jgi:16S rRNA (cytidine1402-2'-O)-methyltransferase